MVNECGRGFAESELGKFLVVGSVKDFYARAKLAKEAEKRQSWTTVGSKEGNSIRVIRNVAFCEDRP